jgi:hypothetical protein
MQECLPAEANEVAHRSDSEVGHEVHATSMELINKRAPVIDGSPMRVKNGKIQWRETWV